MFFRYSRIEGKSSLCHEGISKAFCTSAVGGNEWSASHSGTPFEWADSGDCLKVVLERNILCIPATGTRSFNRYAYISVTELSCVQNVSEY
jgi:hypothetical protein